MAQMICLILSVVFAVLAAAAVPQIPRFQFLPAAVAFLALAFLLGSVPALR